MRKCRGNQRRSQSREDQADETLQQPISEGKENQPEKLVERFKKVERFAGWTELVEETTESRV